MFWRRRNEELDEEIASHIAHEADRLEAAGLPRGEAEAAARRAFGPCLRTHEETRGAWRTGAFEAALFQTSVAMIHPDGRVVNLIREAREREEAQKAAPQ